MNGVNGMKYLFFTTLLGSISAHAEPIGPAPVPSNAQFLSAEDGGGKLVITGAAAEGVFQALPKGCITGPFIARGATGVICLRDTQKATLYCQMIIGTNGVEDLLETPSNCANREK